MALIHQVSREIAMQTLGEPLQQPVAMHGQLCPRQVLGVRLAVVGCCEVGIDDPNKGRPYARTHD